MALLSKSPARPSPLRSPGVRRLWLLALLLACCLRPDVRAQDQPSPEYQLKAVFLFNFAQFVDWPATAFPTASTPLVVGILGDDPFGSYLDGLVVDEKIQGHPLIVRRFRRAADLEFCHVLFISASESGRLPEILAALKSRSTLTVGDSPEFNRNGGMIRFVSEAGKIRLRINVEVAKACGLTLSSKLLRPATIVTTKSP